MDILLLSPFHFLLFIWTLILFFLFFFSLRFHLLVNLAKL